MRLFEIASKTLVPVQTARFKKNFATLKRGYTEIGGKLVDFLAFKTRNPAAQHSRKDTAFVNNGNLKGFRHEHLVLGKVIIIYQIAENQLRLLDCVEHKAFEGAAKALAGYVKGQVALEPLPKKKPKLLNDESKQEVVGLIYEFTQSDTHILRAALKGDWVEFMEWATELTGQTEQVIFATFGGKTKMADEIKTAMSHVGLNT